MTSRKVDKPRAADSVAVVPLKPREQSELKKGNETEKRPVVNPQGSASPRNLRRLLTPRDNRRRPTAPSIRLPRPEVAETYRLTSFNFGDRAHGSYGAPRFYQASDGTRIVKFPDGSSRVVKPGQRSGY